MSGGVLRTPRQVPVPPLNPQSLKAAQALTLNDEVAQILNGLKLEKSFFMDRIKQEPLQELAPPCPPELSNGDMSDNLKAQRRRDNLMRSQRRRGTVLGMGGMGPTATLHGTGNLGNTGKLCQKTALDFDIYLNEAVMPVLAQALDALCRQLTRMGMQGNDLDPKVRARFNPLTWLAQQLLRRHPKCARTPRRHLLYKNFKDWSDYEKGRREMLRLREEVHEVFAHFVLRGGVAFETMWDVVISIDDTFKLEGQLKGSVELERALKGIGVTKDWLHRFQPGVSWSFDEFWYHFGNTVMKNDLVPYSLILRGLARRQQEQQEAKDWQEKLALAETERQVEEEQKRQRIQQYSVLYEQLMADPQILAMMNEGKILTGDDVRPGDIGYEFEIPPHGRHIQLLADFLVLAGIEGAKLKDNVSACSSLPPTAPSASKTTGLLRSAAKAQHLEGAEGERYWDDDLAGAWTTLQRVHRVELCDGVVDGAVLQQVLVPPIGFNLLRGKVEYELERKEEDGGNTIDELAGFLDQQKTGEKPSMEQLAIRLGMTMSRLEWLHKLFESFLEPEVPGGPAPCCMYPEMPASLNKEQVRALVKEVEPTLSAAQFDARYKRIDQDHSGMIEFDEFAHWIHSSDVQIAGNATMKMNFEELAHRYQEPLDLIMYLHSCFQDQLPDGCVDNYPDDPVGLPKQEAIFLAGILTPGFDQEEFAANFELVDDGSRQSGYCDFDEFVELLDFGELPAEIRNRYESMEN